MKRRAFITLLGGAIAAPLAAHAQQARMRRIGVLLATAEHDRESQARLGILQQALKPLGWNAGENVQIDARWADGDAGRLQIQAGNLAASKPDVIVTSGTTPTRALKRENTSIPVVFVQVIDPVGAGFVASLARPGGNVTGFASYESGLAAKWLELLKQIAPNVTRVAMVRDAVSGAAAELLREMQAVAQPLSMRVTPMAVRDVAEAERAVGDFAREPNGGLIVVGSPFTVAHRDLIIRLAAQHRLPSIYPFSYMAQDGGLASYGIDNHDMYRRAASYVDRILKGEKPGDLPVQQATKFELVINLKTAKTLGIAIPQSVLLRADEVIE